MRLWTMNNLDVANFATTPRNFRGLVKDYLTTQGNWSQIVTLNDDHKILRSQFVTSKRAKNRAKKRSFLMKNDEKPLKSPFSNYFFGKYPKIQNYLFGKYPKLTIFFFGKCPKAVLECKCQAYYSWTDAPFSTLLYSGLHSEVRHCKSQRNSRMQR